MSENPEFLIEGILPANEVHLLGGSSGSGKTTLLFQTLADWQDGKAVFGHQSFPVPYSYLSIDRSRSSVTRTLQRLNLQDQITRLICQEELTQTRTIQEVIEVGQNIHSDSLLYVIEGYQTLVGDKGNSYAPVSSLLRRSANMCSRRKITILGVAHSPKMKVDEAFQHSRELILGSVAWGAYSDTVITVQLEETTSNITVRILPRNAPSETFHYVFGPAGVLLPLENVKPRDAIRLKLEALSSGTIILRAEILQWARAYKVSDKTADRVISDCLKNKVLTAVDVGVYERSDRPPLSMVQEPDIIVE